MDLIRRGYHWGWNEPSPPLTFLVPSERDRLCYDREHSNRKAIYEVPLHRCLLSRIFHVPKSDVSHRLVIVLVRLNDHFTFPRTFTYLLKHPLTLIHAAGIPVIAYLDDLCLWGDSPQDVPASVEKFPVSWRSWNSCRIYRITPWHPLILCLG